MTIKSWQEFGRTIRNHKGTKLLSKLPKFHHPVLVTGCQRSGTTILTNVLSHSKFFVDYQTSDDSELDGAQLLCGHHDIPQDGRYCLQTTYLNESYPEYFEHLNQFKLVFIIRNPFSVVYSMCYHWGSRLRLTNFALNELFLSCGALDRLTAKEQWLMKLFGIFGVSTIRRACLAYVGKTSQLFTLQEKLGDDLIIVEYNDLVDRKQELLPHICSFIDIPSSEIDCASIHQRSLNRSEALSKKQKAIIETNCLDLYKQVQKLAIKLT